MLLFAHAGITLGAAALLAKASEVGAVSPQDSGSRDGIASWFVSLGRRIDIRLLVIGALLPDIIDKPLGQYLLRDTFSYGRIYTHTLLFLALIALAGWLLYAGRRRNWLLVLAFGTFMHLLLDSMWGNLPVLFWPLYGWGFPRVELAGWLSGTILYGLLHKPAVYVPEILGAAVIVWFGWGLLRRSSVGGFIRYGRVE